MAPTAQELDFSFLRRAVDAARLVRRPPLNVFSLSGFPRRETVASNVLAFFLDPHQSHELGGLFVDSLLLMLDGEYYFTPAEDDAPPQRRGGFEAASRLGSQNWMVVTEAATVAGNRVDVLLTNEALDVAIVIENKVDADFDNPLEDYVTHCARRFGVVLSLVLAPTQRTIGRIPEQDLIWLSTALTYDDVFARVRAAMASLTQPVGTRVAVLLDQFQENLSAKEAVVSSEIELERVARFWEALGPEPDTLPEFFHVLATVNRVLKRRSEIFRDEIVARLGQEPTPALLSSFVSVGLDHRWGVREGWVTVVWVGFALSTGVTVELIVGGDPRDFDALSAKAYRTEAGPQDLLAGYSAVPLHATLSGSGVAVAEEFVGLIRQLEGGQQVV
ncbi:MAG: PD-(D/E)XK nuclease family protein [Propionicimonas sp.]